MDKITLENRHLMDCSLLLAKYLAEQNNNCNSLLYSLPFPCCEIEVHDDKAKSSILHAQYEYDEGSIIIKLLENLLQTDNTDNLWWEFVYNSNDKAWHLVDGSNEWLIADEIGTLSRKRVTDCAMEYLMVFLSVNLHIRDYKTDWDVVEIKKPSNESIKKVNGSHNKNDTVRLYRCYSLASDDIKNTPTKKKHNITMSSWGVRGHYRHYSNGKVVFVKSFVKGKHRETYVSKTYKI